MEHTSSSYQNFHGSYSDSEVFCKKELAGRTMEFSYDVSQTPLIGRRLLFKLENDPSQSNVKLREVVSELENFVISFFFLFKLYLSSF
jgi:hypothetical protein